MEWVRTAGDRTINCLLGYSSLRNSKLCYTPIYEGIIGDYQKKINEEWFDNDIREIAKENKLADWIVKNIWLINKKRNRDIKGIHILDFGFRHCILIMVGYYNPFDINFHKLIRRMEAEICKLWFKENSI